MRTLTSLWVAGSCAQFLFGTVQDTVPKANFVQQLQTTYVQTVVAADKLKVTQAGSVLVVQKDGIGASRATGKSGITPLFRNSFEDGEIKQGRTGVVLKHFSRDLAVGERVYLTKMEMKDDAIVFYILTCGACDPSGVDPSQVPHKASLRFEFPEGWLATATFNQIQPIIGRVFTIGNPTTTVPPPLPPAPPDPVHIGLGQTTKQIVAALGQPETAVQAGDGKEIYVYKTLKITFVSGKVTDIQ